MENNLTSWNFSLDTGSAGKDSLYVLACPPLLPTRYSPWPSLEAEKAWFTMQGLAQQVSS